MTPDMPQFVCSTFLGLETFSNSLLWLGRLSVTGVFPEMGPWITLIETV